MTTLDRIPHHRASGVAAAEADRDQDNPSPLVSATDVSDHHHPEAAAEIHSDRPDCPMEAAEDRPAEAVEDFLVDHQTTVTMVDVGGRGLRFARLKR